MGKIGNGEVEINRITKTVLVIDEAQDMTEDEFALVEALIRKNENLKVVAVGDDDQNIYSFRRSNSRYMRKLVVRNDRNSEQVRNTSISTFVLA